MAMITLNNVIPWLVTIGVAYVICYSMWKKDKISISTAVVLLLLTFRLWAAPMIGMLLSAAIEIAQLVTRCGLFELDDIFRNTLGAIIGALSYIVVKKHLERRWE